jgi:hypothetical protein
MIDQFFSDPASLQRLHLGPIGLYIDAFVQHRNLSTSCVKTPVGRGSAGVYSLATSLRLGTSHRVRIFLTGSLI